MLIACHDICLIPPSSEPDNGIPPGHEDGDSG